MAREVKKANLGRCLLWRPSQLPFIYIVEKASWSYLVLGLIRNRVCIKVVYRIPTYPPTLLQAHNLDGWLVFKRNLQLLG
jgi:hypothetical protein